MRESGDRGKRQAHEGVRGRGLRARCAGPLLKHVSCDSVTGRRFFGSGSRVPIAWEGAFVADETEEDLRTVFETMAAALLEKVGGGKGEWGWQRLLR